MYLNGAVCSHGDFLEWATNAFSTSKIKHIHFEQWRVRSEELKTDGQAGTTAGVKGGFKIITISSVISY